MAAPNQFCSPGGIKLRAYAGRANELTYPKSVGHAGHTERKVSFTRYCRDPSRVKVNAKYNNITIVSPPLFEPEAKAVLTKNNVDLYPASFNEEWIDTFTLESITAYVSANFHGMKVSLLDTHLRYTSARLIHPSCIILTLTQGDTAAGLRPQVLGTIRISKISSAAYPIPTWRLKYNDLARALDKLEHKLPHSYTEVFFIKEHQYIVDEVNGSVVIMAGYAPRDSVCVVSLASHMESLTPKPGTQVRWPAKTFWPANILNGMRDIALQRGQKPIRLDLLDDANYPILAATKTFLGELRLRTKSTTAYENLGVLSYDQEMMRAVWFNQLCCIVVHELGHCFGISHCDSSCVMSEDKFQIVDKTHLASGTPYFCPSCLDKLSFTIHGEGKYGQYPPGKIQAGCELAWVQIERYGHLLRFCESKADENPWFKAYGVWIRGVLARYKQDFVKRVMESASLPWSDRVDNPFVNDHPAGITYGLF